MKKFAFVLMALFIFAGCQKEETAVQPQPDQRKDISHKLILKSLSDLQNKDLNATVMDLETSIKINPAEPEAYLLLGQILLKVGEYEHAADFLEIAAKTFPNDGTVFYMLGVADKMSDRKGPAVLAARHSFEIFQAQQDRDNMLKSAALLHDLLVPAETAQAPAQKQDTTKPQPK